MRRGGGGNLLGDHFQNLDCFLGGHFQKRNRALLWDSFHEKWYKETVSCNMGSLYKNWDEVGGRFENLLSFRKMVGSPSSQVINDTSLSSFKEMQFTDR